MKELDFYKHIREQNQRIFDLEEVMRNIQLLLVDLIPESNPEYRKQIEELFAVPEESDMSMFAEASK